jgi:alpha-galactosidase
MDWQQLGEEQLMVRLQAQNAPLQAEHHWKVDPASGMLQRHTLLRHSGSGPSLHITHAGSFAVLLPPAVQRLTHLAGVWSAETQVQQLSLPQSALLLESRAGKTSFEQSPYVALQGDNVTYIFELAWSGNWQLHIHRLFDGWVNVSGGLNDWGLSQILDPGQEFALPAALLGAAAGDLNMATQRLHDFRRQARPDHARPVPVQFNSWYPYPGEPPVEKMKAFVEVAARLGCEVFVQDAGWYTTEQEDPQENWWTRTGDWVVNRRLFPNGLEELSDYCHSHGLGFGIWFEPEAVSPSAVVRREHPEWLHHIDGEPPRPDQRAILHLGVPAARAFVRERILTILRQTNATWMKWDFNTELRQGGWAPGLPESLTHRDPLLAHCQGLYLLQDELRAALPALVLEMCAGGGGRFDAAILSHAHTNWMSDQTQPLKNLAIHFGSQLAHPAIECNDWLIEWPPYHGLHSASEVDYRGDLAFRTRIAMLGTFGISAPVEKWSEDEITLVQSHVAWYKQRVRPLLHEGEQ